MRRAARGGNHDRCDGDIFKKLELSAKEYTVHFRSGFEIHFFG